ncbi:hypothetical protein GWI34_32330 [Actinomadura sp. DSM 109109]|nr:hypothetical protein [Actinomadura lepetitiana]
MIRSARSLFRVSVLASFAAAVAVTAAPTDAAPAKPAPSAAPGPSTPLLDGTAATGRSVMRTLPDPIARTGGDTTGEVLRAAPAGPGMRAARAGCRVRPAKTVESGTGLELPSAQLPSLGQTPIGGLPQGDCPAATHRDARERELGTALPVLSGAKGGDVPGTLLGGTTKLNKVLPTAKLSKGLPTSKLLSTGRLGRSEGAPPAAPNGRAAEAPISMAGPGGGSGLPAIGSLLGGVKPGGLPLGSVLFPPAARYAGPAPSGDLAGQAGGTLDKATAGLGRNGGVGNVVDVLKARDGSLRKGDPKPADGPLSMPGASVLGVEKVPALPPVPGVPAVGGKG